MKTLAAVLVASVWWVGLDRAEARPVALDDGAVEATIPDDWQSGEQQGAVVAADPSGEASVMFLTTAASLESAMKAAPAQLRTLLDKVELDRAQATQINGMNALAATGNGSAGKGDGRVKVEIGVLVVETPNRRALYVFAFARAGTSMKHAKALEQILGGLRPRGTAKPALSKRSLRKAAVVFDAPKDWPVEFPGDAMMTYSPRRELTVILLPVPDATLEQAYQGAAGVVDGYAKEVRWGQPAAGDHNGMRSVRIAGVGRLGDRPVAVDVVIADRGKSGALIAFTLLLQGEERSYRTAAQEILGSIAPSR